MIAARLSLVGLGLVAASALLVAGPYDGPAGSPGSCAIAYTDPAIIGWASGVAELVRGPAQIDAPELGAADFGVGENALGPVRRESLDDVFDVVSLGDGGRITLTFDGAITDGPGWDFAVFENGFAGSFLELAFVEVSSDGINFFRFDARSETPTATQVGSFQAVDPTALHNLAGKYAGGFGTPFDLAELTEIAEGDPRLDLRAITHVRVVDVIGTIAPAYASRDGLGRIINEPWPTPFGTGGFDLDGVAVRHFAPAEPPVGAGYAAWRAFHFSAAERDDATLAGDDADPDGDGLPNLLEYALAGAPRDPTDGVALAPRLLHANGRLGLGYRPGAGVYGLLWSVEWSADLVDWDSTAARLHFPETTLDGEVRVWARPTLAEEPRQFLRLRVSRLLP